MKNKNITLLKNAGEHKINKDFCLNVLSVFDEENWAAPSNVDAINIALYHGAIDRSLTDLNWTLGGDHDISIFDSFDFAFLGDIHKTQILDKQGRIRYDICRKDKTDRYKMSLFNEYGNASIDNQNAVSFSFFLFLKKSFNLTRRPAKV